MASQINASHSVFLRTSHDVARDCSIHDSRTASLLHSLVVPSTPYIIASVYSFVYPDVHKYLLHVQHTWISALLFSSSEHCYLYPCHSTLALTAKAASIAALVVFCTSDTGRLLSICLYTVHNLSNQMAVCYAIFAHLNNFTTLAIIVNHGHARLLKST